jgi:nucleoside-diphosphate kinase
MAEQIDKKERTLVVIKPDGVQRGLIGEVIGRYERSGLKLVGIKMLVPTPEFTERHYTLDPTWRERNGKKTIEAYKAKGLVPPSEDPLAVNAITLGKLKKYLSSGPVVAMVWQGMHAVAVVRKITGSTEPLVSDVGTIRGDLTIDSYQAADEDGRVTRNIIHASGSPEEAKMEVDFWFKPEELINYRLVTEEILYDVNLDGILE